MKTSHIAFATPFSLGASYFVVANDAPSDIKAWAKAVQDAGGNVFVCDGIDDDAQIQAAIDSAPNTGAGIQFVGPTFTCSSQLVWTKNGIWLRGDETTILDFSSAGAMTTGCIRSYGSGITDTDTTALLASNASVDDSTVTLVAGSVAALGLVADDIIFVASDEVYSGTSKVGELQRIKSIAGQVLTLEGKLFDGYLTSDTAHVRRAVPVTGTRLSDFKVLGDDGTTNQIGIRLEIQVAPIVENVYIEATNHAGVDAYQWFGGEIKVRTKGVNRAGYGYGVIVERGSRDVVVDIDARDGRHGVDLGGAWGVPRYMIVKDFAAHNMTQSAINTHFGEFLTINHYKISDCANHGISIIDCSNSYVGPGTITDCTGGIRVDSINIIVESPTIIRCGSDSTTINAINVFDQATGAKILSPTLIDCPGYYGIYSIASDCLIVDPIVIGATSGTNIRVNAFSRAISNISIINPFVDSTGTVAEGIQVYAQAYDLEHVKVIGGTSKNSTTAGIAVYPYATFAINHLTVKDNHCYDDQGTPTQDYGLSLAGTMADAEISGNDLNHNTAAGLFKRVAAPAYSGTNIKIHDNHGWVTENSGTSSIDSGQTTKVVAHGLAETPTVISIAFREQGDNDFGRWWVDTIGAANFTLNVSADPGASNLDFAWEAKVR